MSPFDFSKWFKTSKTLVPQETQHRNALLCKASISSRLRKRFQKFHSSPCEGADSLTVQAKLNLGKNSAANCQGSLEKTRFQMFQPELFLWFLMRMQLHEVNNSALKRCIALHKYTATGHNCTPCLLQSRNLTLDSRAVATAFWMPPCNH